MSPEELDEARAEEAYRQWQEEGCQGDDTLDVAAIAARLAREGWTPPDPVDPDILAFREWLATSPWHPGSDGDEADLHPAYRPDGMLCQTYRAGARMAAERERERAKVLVEVLVEFIGRVRPGVFNNLDHANHEARKVLAKYRGEA